MSDQNKREGFISESYEGSDGSKLRDANTFIIDYYDLDEDTKTTVDHFLSNASVLLASKLYEPNMIPPPFFMDRTQGLGRSIFEMAEHFGQYQLRPEMMYYITVHPKVTQEHQPLFRFQIVEVNPQAMIVKDEDMRVAFHMMFQNIDDIIQTRFKADFDAMIKHYAETAGQAKAEMHRMVNSTDYKTSLAAVTTQHDIFYTFIFSAQGAAE